MKRILGTWELNTKNGDTVFAIRDDGVTSVSVTVPASTTGAFDSGDVTGLILSGSLINWMVDTSASSSGSLDDLQMNAWGFET